MRHEWRKWGGMCLVLASLLGCSAKPAAVTTELTADREAPNAYLQGVPFRDLRVHERYTSGTLPPVGNGSARILQPADHAVLGLDMLAPAESVPGRVYGLEVTGLPAPRAVPGKAAAALTRVRVQLWAGPIDRLPWQRDPHEWLPGLPPFAWHPMPLPDLANAATPLEEIRGMRPLFTGVLRLRDGLQRFSFPAPLPSLPVGEGYWLRVSDLEPFLDPTIGEWQADQWHLVVPNAQKSAQDPRVIAPEAPTKNSACYGSPLGQVLCLYPSGVLEFYARGPFMDVDYRGRFAKRGNILELQFSPTEKRLVDLGKPGSPFDLGALGTGFLIKQGNDARLDPTTDVRRALAEAGDGQWQPEDVVQVYHASLMQGLEMNTIARLRNGAVAVFARHDGFSKLTRVLYLPVPPSMSLFVLSVPEEGRAVFALQKAPEQWWVFRYQGDRLTLSMRAHVPWQAGDQAETLVPERERPRWRERRAE